MNDLRGSIALLTGASRGIGPHIARALAKEGVHLALAARSGPELEAVASEMRSLGVRAIALTADVGRPDACVQLAASAAAGLGPVDLLVNNAGIETVGPFVSLGADEVLATVATNLSGPLLLAREVLPGMIARRGGHVVNVASIAGKKGAPFEAVYCATKAGLVEWTGAMRLELAGTGVSLSAVCPGLVTGEGMFARFGQAPPRALGSCTPQEVASAVVDAIRRDQPEVIVNSHPLRPLLALAALSPRVGERILHLLGIPEFQRKKAGGGSLPGAGQPKKV